MENETKHEIDEFDKVRKACKGVLEYLGGKNPHVSVIITQDNMRVTEDILGIPTGCADDWNSHTVEDMKQAELKFNDEIAEGDNTAKTLAELRKARHMSQSEVANKLGVTYQAYAHYEKGRRQISLIMGAHLALILQVSMEQLYLSVLNLE